MDSTRVCRGCNGEFPETPEFFSPRKRNRGGLYSRCRDCERAYRKEYEQRPGVRERRNALARKRKRPPEQIRRHRLWTFYRLTPEAFDAMLAQQGGRCYVSACGATEPGGPGTWQVDHDHSCCPGIRSCGDCVRGLLCHYCNITLGYARDNSRILRDLADYLDKHAALSALGPIGG